MPVWAIEVQIGDTLYEIDVAYRRGAEDFNDGVPNNCNPYRFGSYAHDQWDTAHCHEDDSDTRLAILLAPVDISFVT